MSTLAEFKSNLKAIIKILIDEEITPESDNFWREKFSKEPEMDICSREHFECMSNNIFNNLINATTNLAKFTGAFEVLKSQLNEATTEDERNIIRAKINEYTNELSDIYEENNIEMEQKEQERLARYEIYFNKRTEEHQKVIAKWNLEKSRWMLLYLTDEYIESLFEEYQINHKIVIDRIIETYHYEWMPFRPIISLDFEYTRSISSNDKVAKCILNAIHNYHGNDRHELLMSYDLTIEELLEITKIFTNPSYPLVNCHHEDEYETDSSQQFDMISNENLRYVIQAAKNNLDYRNIMVNLPNSLTFKIPNEEPKIEHISSNVMECYSSKIDYNKTIEVSNDNVKNQFITTLYTGTFDRNISNEDAEELFKLFISFNLTSFAFLCQLVPAIRSNEKVDIFNKEEFEDESVIVKEYLSESENDDEK